MDNDNQFTTCSRPQRMPIKSERLRNPFLLKIDEESLKTDCYKEGIKLNIICECSFWLFAFWAVKIKELHEKLAYDWITLRNLLIDSKFNDDQLAYHSNDPELYQDEFNKIVQKINSPDELNPSFFTTTPRDRYPLVVILLLNDRDFQEQIDNNDIVMLTSIIHLKDTIATFATSIIGQYIKRKSGVVLNLQDLYVCSDQSDDSKNMPNCIICLDQHITRAILPCRHACVCSNCFDQITTCPLCRSPIQNFIIINQPVISGGDAKSKINDENCSHSDNHKNQSLMKKFQKFLGF